MRRWLSPMASAAPSVRQIHPAAVGRAPSVSEQSLSVVIFVGLRGGKLVPHSVVGGGTKGFMQPFFTDYKKNFRASIEDGKSKEE